MVLQLTAPKHWETIYQYKTKMDLDEKKIVEVLDAGTGPVATIHCHNRCHAAGD